MPAGGETKVVKWTYEPSEVVMNSKIQTSDNLNLLETGIFI